MDVHITLITPGYQKVLANLMRNRLGRARLAKGWFGGSDRKRRNLALLEAVLAAAGERVANRCRYHMALARVAARLECGGNATKIWGFRFDPVSMNDMIGGRGRAEKGSGSEGTGTHQPRGGKTLPNHHADGRCHSGGQKKRRNRLGRELWIQAHTFAEKGNATTIACSKISAGWGLLRLHPAVFGI